MILLIFSVLSLNGAPDTLVVCPEPLIPAITSWKERREREGRTISFLSSEGTAEEIKSRVEAAHRQQPAKFLVLVGDAPSINDLQSENKLFVPTHYVPAKVIVNYGPERVIATDHPYADLDGDGIPELAVGRIPAKSQAELKAILRKVEHYEEHQEAGDWARRINIVACLAQFGPILDNALESGARRMVMDGIPTGYTTCVTYGNWRSPYCPAPPTFRETTLDRLNEGCLFWVYIGHGHQQTVDRIMVPGKKYPIFTSPDVPKLACREGHPIAIFLACYTGCFDGPRDSLGEDMLRSPGGPVAVLAGSRVTMPYAMTCLSGGLMNAYFNDRVETIGEMMQVGKTQLLSAKRDDSQSKFVDSIARLLSPKGSNLADERREHVYLFNILGDPTLRIPHAEKLSIEFTGDVVPGKSITITGESPLAGKARFELVVRRDRFRSAMPNRKTYEERTDSLADFRETYRLANDPVLSSREIEVPAGRFTLELQIPETANGACHVRSVVIAGKRFAVGHRDIDLGKKPGT